MLFTIYVHDLPTVAKNCSTECYVDGTNLYASFRLCDHAQAADKMNQDLARVRDWSFNNQLLLNPEKTKIIVFGSRQMRSKLQEFRLSLLGKDIIPVLTATNMGVGFDSELSFDDHIIKTVSTCMSRLGLAVAPRERQIILPASCDDIQVYDWMCSQMSCFAIH